MVRADVYDGPVVITADQLRDARIRAGFTSQAAFAEALGVSERTVSYWESEGGKVSRRAEARVRDLLWPAPSLLSSYSNFELLSEIARRLEGISIREVVRAQEDSPDADVSETDPSVYTVGNEGRSIEPSPTEGQSGDASKIGPRILRGRGPSPKA